MASRTVHLVGSVPLANATDVFTTVSAALGDKLARIPDGETGARSDWLGWLEPAFANNPALAPADDPSKRRRYKLKAGRTPGDVEFPNLFYAGAAQASFAEFRRLKASGVILPGTRFQVDIPPAHSVFGVFLVEELHGVLDAAYNAALEREIGKIAEAIPHDELAVQIDVASAVFARLEFAKPNNYGRTKGEMQSTFGDILSKLAGRVPQDVDLLFHFCYGDLGHRHVVEPTDMADMVELANRLSRDLSRPIQLIHMPVPRGRIDDAYFESLKDLALGEETLVCLGLIHFTDGVAGSRKRCEIAKQFCREFAVATECGFGRRPPETIPELLRIHVEVAESS